MHFGYTPSVPSTGIVVFDVHISVVALPSLSPCFWTNMSTLLASHLSYTECAFDRHGVRIANSAILVASTDKLDP